LNCYKGVNKTTQAINLYYEIIMDDSIKFEIKDSDTNKDIKSVRIFRSYKQENGENVWGYIDSLHPMSTMELLILKNTLQEYLYNNDWD
tara:strand:- start:5257 stop:5523 length:267 start_codon:yes stop_codon:yes gene_type:complete